ncbi:TPR-like protein [Wolfiporia cocos MD-104 SS10]|uniref:TPR-like protein n=1 Tax=Wolfiporia cocos (strain MD-104) TaxID=742152 RepID=A0A2H3JTJ0_WOLCO|nr:TPR-like protein [Wolfiporia cocos MD-104 SS10]
MQITPQPTGSYTVSTASRLSSPPGSRPRHSLNSSFSFGPQSLVTSFAEASASSASNARSLALDPNRSILQASPLCSSPRLPRRAKTSTTRHPLANDTTDIFQEDNNDETGEGESYQFSIIDRMRLWRHDALMQHLYDTAAFWGDKIVSWTNDPNDAFWLAQTYFLTHQYSRAERLLTRPFPTTPPRSGPGQSVLSNGQLSGATGNGKGKARELQPETVPTIAPIIERLPVGPSEMVDVAAQHDEGFSRLVDMSVACRYLAAQCQVRQGKWTEATEMLGEANPFRDSGRSGPDIPNMDGGIKACIEASMCNLRGLLMLKLNRGDQAKLCFMEALALDVKCYEAFEQLVSGEMMIPDEEWEFVQGLAYREQTPEDGEFIRLMYMSRLRKYKHAEEHAIARTRLVTEYGLGDNPDVLFAFADALYAQFRWADCFAITTRILGLTSVHAPTLPLHIACMHHLSHLNSKLFVLAHELVDREPESPISWYAVGIWYLSAKKWAEARTYFSKTSLMDPRFAPAWIAFAHTFAHEGEHDHAVTAYSTCARMFTGSHLPLMFVGMEHIVLSNHSLADESLNAAYSICDGDPLLANERGVMAYNHEDYERAVELFNEALEFAKVVQTSKRAWAHTYMNLGTSYRKLGRFQEAKKAYQQVLEIDPRNQTALAFLGMTYHLMGNIDAAIVKYHEASATLSIDPINGQVLELLDLALEASVEAGPFAKKGPPGGEEAWAQKMREHRDRDKGKQVATRDYPSTELREVDEDMSVS